MPRTAPADALAIADAKQPTNDMMKRIHATGTQGTQETHVVHHKFNHNLMLLQFAKVCNRPSNQLVQHCNNANGG
jgi:hypothetical protein